MKLRYSRGASVILLVAWSFMALFLLNKFEQVFNPFGFDLQVYQQVNK